MKQYWACKNNFEWKLSEKVEHADQAWATVWTEHMPEEVATTILPLGKNRIQAEEKLASLQKEAAEEKSTHFSAHKDVERRVIDKMRTIVGKFQRDKDKFMSDFSGSENIGYDFSWAQGLMESQAQALVATKVLSAASRGKNPLEALKFYKERTEEDILNGNFRWSGGPFHTAVAECTRSGLCSFVTSFEIKDLIWDHERREEARGKLGLEPTDLEVPWEATDDH